MDDDSIIILKLFLFASNIRKEIYDVLDYFLSSFKKHEKRKAHNMFSLMLDP
jgi:hypothetical protein